MYKFRCRNIYHNLHLTGISSCPFGMVACSDEGLDCVREDYLCDGYEDCHGGTDESALFCPGQQNIYIEQQLFK